MDQSPDNTKDFAYTYDNIGKHEDYTIGIGSPIYYCPNELNQYDAFTGNSAFVGIAVARTDSFRTPHLRGNR